MQFEESKNNKQRKKKYLYASYTGYYNLIEHSVDVLEEVREEPNSAQPIIPSIGLPSLFICTGGQPFSFLSQNPPGPAVSNHACCPPVQMKR